MPIIINGGTTTFQMVHFLATRRLQVFTNSFPIAEHLMQAFARTVMVPGGIDLSRAEHHPLAVRERRDAQFLSPAACSWARKGSGALGVMERDPLIIQAEQKLIDQADELIVLVNSSH